MLRGSGGEEMTTHDTFYLLRCVWPVFVATAFTAGMIGYAIGLYERGRQ